ncbi:uncharacterized protein SAPINGB_P002676 [Magnusiomyces paraingens]|uniref:AMP-dependent synthetase/ligase domain-containing protein n=1 Tax=Magnusiomyces paraingens TaxID=2606893 RepID=A0A5E8BHB4_9ASCO|nr:uncharacterized protein SAPINGB_P002676 [Saprochaete ingens]VVT50251.1 unnamed protein product [Saprochaete ingens]
MLSNKFLSRRSSMAIPRLMAVASQLRANSTSSTSPVLRADHPHYVPPPPNNHELNPAYFLYRSSLLEPEAKAIVYRSRTNRYYTRTYAEFADRVKGLAYFFKHNGYKKIAIIAPNTPAHLETMFAATASGGIVEGINYRLTKKEIDYILNLGEADLVIVDREFAHLAEPIPGKRRVIVDEDVADDEIDKLDCEYGRVVRDGIDLDALTYKQGWDGLYAEDIDENSTLGLFFTSGTTGNPKAVEYTHRGVYLAALAQISESQLNCQDSYGNHRCTYLWTLPLFHAAGWTFPYAVTAARGTHVLLRRIDVDYIWGLLTRERITHFSAAPTVNTMLLNSKRAQVLKHEVKVIVAAAPPSAKLFGDMISHNLIPVHSYGLTETYGPSVTRFYKEDWNKMPATKIFENMAKQGYGFLTCQNLKVIKEGSDNMEDEVEANGKEIGEIMIRGNIVAKGYYNDPEATAKAFKNGWFHSGDLAVVHTDGAIEVLDRAKDIIISGGENISSVYVESHIVKYHNILECAVIGIKDDHYGEVPYALITLQDPSQNIDGEDIRKWLRNFLGGYQIPKRIEVVKELPKTSTGKVRKNILRDEWNKKVHGEVKKSA